MKNKVKELEAKKREKLSQLRQTTRQRTRDDLWADITELEGKIDKLKESGKEEKEEKEEQENLKEVECKICGQKFKFDVVCYPDMYQVDEELCISDEAHFDLPYDGFTFQGSISDDKVYCAICTQDHFQKIPGRKTR